jgi:long-chain fatty acid transport protein
MLLSLLLFFNYTDRASAAGFFIQEQSASGLATAYAGSVSEPRDASIIYFNPAGMAHLDGVNANIAGNLIYGDTDMTNTGTFLFGAPLNSNDGGNPVGLKAVPNIFYSHQINDNIWLGLGVTFPFGLGSKYNANWFGRFDSIKSELKTIDIQPSIAVNVLEWLSIGAGLNIQSATVKLTSAISDGLEGLSTLEGDDQHSYGYSVGVLFQPVKESRIGITYKSNISHDIDGRALVEGTAFSDTNVGVKSELDLPDIFSIGFSQHLSEDWILFAQANWFGWNSFQSIKAFTNSGTLLSEAVQNYKTTWSTAIGVEYLVNNNWSLRTGYQYDETPTRDNFRTTRTPDGNRHWFAGGTTFGIAENFSVDLSAAYIHVEEEEVNVTRNSGLATVSMDIDSSIYLFSFGLNYKF